MMMPDGAKDYNISGVPPTDKTKPRGLNISSSTIIFLPCFGDLTEENMNVNTCPCHPLVGLVGEGGGREGGAGSGAAL